MEVVVFYNPQQIEAAVNFIAQNNSSFKNKHRTIRKSIQDSISEIAQKFPDLRSLSTMGYIVIGFASEEGLDLDQNELRIEVYVDPAVALDYEEKEEYFYFAPKE